MFSPAIHDTVLTVADFVAQRMPPTLTVVLVFAIAYLVVGIPVHFRRGAESRDVLGSLAGLFAGLMYLVFLLGVYPGLHSVHLADAPPRVASHATPR
ncbi:hypothetical protein [Paraburkholderia sp.]|uniref:hypothetical protein n=1 Tax=Paraburkholderia sp. TaxID=1926495 RepID=UPI003D6E3DC3